MVHSTNLRLHPNKHHRLNRNQRQDPVLKRLLLEGLVLEIQFVSLQVLEIQVVFLQVMEIQVVSLQVSETILLRSRKKTL